MVKPILVLSILSVKDVSLTTVFLAQSTMVKGYIYIRNHGGLIENQMYELLCRIMGSKIKETSKVSLLEDA